MFGYETARELRRELDRVLKLNAAMQQEIDRLRSRQGYLLASVKTQTRTNDKLTQALIDLKREGFNPPPTTTWGTANATIVPDPVLVAIKQRAREGSELYGELLELATMQLDSGAEPEAVVGMILAGGSTAFDYEE